MHSFHLSRFERIQMFLYEYYLGNSILMNFLRITGPLLIISLGYYQYKASSSKPEIAYSSFLLVFALYYFLRPLIYIYKAWNQLRDIELHFEAKETEIELGDTRSTSSLKLEAISKVLIRPTYFVIVIGST